MKNKKKVFGIGTNDYEPKIKKNGVEIKSYCVWRQMLKRVFYEKTLHSTHKCYEGVEMYNEWLSFSSFKKWFDENEHYAKKGWSLDKDLLSHYYKLNKTYSPVTCCFLPDEINKAMVVQKRTVYDLPLGVYISNNGKFVARFRRNGEKRKHLGTFDTIEEAFSAYKETKEAWLKFLANKYKSELDPRAYEALMAYEVRIDD